MLNCKQNNLSKQSSPSTEVSVLKSLISIQSNLDSSPNQSKHTLHSSFKVYSEMKEGILQNQQCRLSLKYEQIHLLMASQQLFLHLQKMQEQYQKLQKQQAIQLIFRLAAIDYSNQSSFFKTPQRCNSPGIVSYDIGMEKKIQNQQLFKIIQELQLQIAGQEICKALQSFQSKILKNIFYQLRWTTKLSQHLEKVKIIIQTFTQRNALNQIKYKAIQIRKYETGFLLINLKFNKINLSHQFYLFYSLKVLQIQYKKNINLKTKKQRIEVSFQLQDQTLKLVKLYKFFIRYCYRVPFDQIRKIQYSFQLSDSQLDLNFQQKLSSQYASQVMIQQQSQNLEPIQIVQNKEQENLQNQILKSKHEIKSSGQIQRSIKLYLSKYEEEYIQIQQQKIKQKLQKKTKSNEQIQISSMKKILNKNKEIFYLIFSLLFFSFTLVCLFL